MKRFYFRKSLTVSLIALGGVLLLELLARPHPYFQGDAIPAFHIWFSFLSALFLLIAAKMLAYSLTKIRSGK